MYEFNKFGKLEEENKKIVNKYVKLLLSIPKTIYINIKIFPIKTALKFPVLVSFDTNIKVYKGAIEIEHTPYFGMIRIGISDGSFNISDRRSTIFNVNKNGKCKFKGSAKISKGASITVGNQGKLSIGNNFYSNANFLCSASREVSFGDDCMLGWNCTVIDGDGHKITSTEQVRSLRERKIQVGSHVWLGAEVSILKDSIIADNVVVGYGTIVAGKFSESNVIIANPKSCIVKKQITWDR